MYIRRPVVDYKFVRVIWTEDLVPPCQTRRGGLEEVGARRVRGEILRDTRPDSLLMKYSPLYIYIYIYILDPKLVARLDSGVRTHLYMHERGQARMRLPLDERQ